MTKSLQDRINAINTETITENAKEKQLITIDASNALDIFINQEELTALLDKVSDKAKTIIPDVHTDKGRKEIAAMAYSVARTKTYLDSIGKDLVSQYKEIPKKIDSGRKFARDSLDILRDEVRKPLDMWEAHQAELKLIEEILDCHIIALDINCAFNKAKEAELERIEQEILAREEIIRINAIREHKHKAKAELERQQREFELKAQIETEKAQAALQAALLLERQKVERMEQERIQEIQRMEQERIQEIQRSERQKQQIIESERQRALEQAAIFADKKRIDEEREQRRASDLTHRLAKQTLALNDVVLCGNINEKQAAAIIDAIVSGVITSLSINY